MLFLAFTFPFVDMFVLLSTNTLTSVMQNVLSRNVATDDPRDLFSSLFH